MNKALLKGLFTMILKFIFWNFVAFAIPAVFIYSVLSDATGGTAIVVIFLLPLFLPSLFYLIYSSYKLFSALVIKTKSTNRIFSAVVAIVASTLQIAALKCIIFLSYIFPRYTFFGKLFQFLDDHFIFLISFTIDLSTVQTFL